jgi:hypothetical protein
MAPTQREQRSAWVSGLSFVGMALLVTGCSTPPPPPQAAESASAPAPAAAPAVAPTISVNELMVTLIDNASHVLWDVEKRGSPRRTRRTG